MTKNTHRAVIETSVPPSLKLIASGTKDICEMSLHYWLMGHPLTYFEEAVILEVATPSSTEP